MTTIPALTVWQPWASLIVAGVKPYEFRGWPAPRAYRGAEIAIHAGARPVRRAEIADLILRLLDQNQAWTTCLKPEALPMLQRWYSSPSLLPLRSSWPTSSCSYSRKGRDEPACRSAV